MRVIRRGSCDGPRQRAELRWRGRYYSDIRLNVNIITGLSVFREGRRCLSYLVILIPWPHLCDLSSPVIEISPAQQAQPGRAAAAPHRPRFFSLLPHWQAPQTIAHQELKNRLFRSQYANICMPITPCGVAACGPWHACFRFWPRFSRPWRGPDCALVGRKKLHLPNRQASAGGGARLKRPGGASCVGRLVGVLCASRSVGGAERPALRA